ncbi:MAG: hybrid sensor histidine kinase/response regulator, partial [Pseudomonadota bacterium]|nr:hybrid sensor histidine kinase/response regulator [Pseudomonadota bacterium]
MSQKITAYGAHLMHSSALGRYLLGLILFGMALAARFALIGILPPSGFPFLTFFPAVLLTAYLAGLWPGLLVAALSTLAAWYFFIDPAGALTGPSRGDQIALIFFSGILVVDCVVLHLMNKAMAQVRSTSEELRESQERLLAQDDALRKASRQKDEFLATLAHELRNPLAPIRNGLHLMKMKGVPEAAVERTRSMMDRQLTHMVRLIDDLMDVSRITRGKLLLRREHVLLAVVVNNAVEASLPLIEQLGQQLTVTLPQQPLTVDGDLTRLAQVFVNLLNNAAKYSDPGGHVQLNVERQGSEVVVTVKDSGIGIDADQLPHIFQMFTQVDRSLEKSQGGLGIGLTLVNRLVEMHGGRVEAKSKGPGQGSEFVVQLPLVVTAIKQQEPSGAAEHCVSSSLRILVVDDNRDGADSLSETLKMVGNDTRTAYDGEAGVDAAGEFRPDVVLLDIGLP